VTLCSVSGQSIVSCYVFEFSQAAQIFQVVDVTVTPLAERLSHHEDREGHEDRTEKEESNPKKSFSFMLFVCFVVHSIFCFGCYSLRILFWRQVVKIKYDPEVDAAYISFKKGPTQVTTVRLTEDIAIDLGPHEEIVGIEILDAAKHLGIDKSQPKVELENLQPI